MALFFLTVHRSFFGKHIRAILSAFRPKHLNGLYKQIPLKIRIPENIAVFVYQPLCNYKPVAAPQTLTRDSCMDASLRCRCAYGVLYQNPAWFLPVPQFQFHMTVLHLLNFLQCIVQKYPGDTNDIRYVDTVRKNTYDPASSQCGYPLPAEMPCSNL